MFSSGVIASSIPSGYSADFTVGSFTDKFGSSYGFQADPNSSPAWQQQGSSTSTTTMYGALDPVIYTTGGTDYQIVTFRERAGEIRIEILHPDQSSTTHLGALFSSITTSVGTITYSDVIGVGVQNKGNANYKVSFWRWTTQSNANQVTNIIGTSGNTTLTIEE
ncbi:MAG: hypothetical protein Unbinned3329contig1000_22 [Prokaryotic dsDNA virus sp.]|jgi:hypothetical protein|nr:MAG: hypothetical protein Unbinned3329contig1000_22 [Prokaryotic dsDNA virus sp.]|tara:strand:- start:1887 stop:2378 length:492 start_codon:yes stop_codon:yes gene_type:complete